MPLLQRRIKNDCGHRCDLNSPKKTLLLQRRIKGDFVIDVTKLQPKITVAATSC